MRAMIDGLDVSSVIRSWKARAGKEEAGSIFERTFDPEQVQPYERAGLI